jgi:hypothetical protein
MFKVSQGKGFQMTFANGWTVSVQWGIGNYCDHYPLPLRAGEDYDRANRDAGSNGSATAEIAAWDANKVWHRFENDDDTVKGYCTPDEVAEFIAKISAL